MGNALPAGCARTTQGNGTSAEILCNSHPGSINFTGWSFRAPGGPCVYLRVTSTVATEIGATITLNDNKFQMDTQCYSSDFFTDNTLITLITLITLGGPGSLIMKSNEVNGNASSVIGSNNLFAA